MKKLLQTLLMQPDSAAIGVIVLSLISCVSPPIRSQQEHIISDTTLIVETLRDTVIRIEADSSLLQALLECDSVGQVQLKQLLKWSNGQNIKPPQVKIHNNILDVKALTQAYQLQLQLKDKTITQLKSSSRQQTQYIEVNRLNSWQIFIQTLGYMFGGLLLLTILYKLFKHHKI